MDRLVHEGAPAIEFPGAAPGRGVVIGLVAVPLHVGRGGGEGAEPSAVSGGLEGIHGGVEAAVEDGGEGDVVFRRSLRHEVDALGSDFEGFFADDVLAGLQRGQGWIKVGAGGCAHRDDLQFFVGKELCEVAESLRAELFREGLCGFGSEVEDGVQFSTFHGLDGLAMKLADHAGPDNSEFHELNPQCMK